MEGDIHSTVLSGPNPVPLLGTITGLWLGTNKRVDSLIETVQYKRIDGGAQRTPQRPPP